ncbi:hypothetical protein SAMN03159358_3055 [Paenibacillus sp. NFR01]|nr:hypothetical protein SAMN03159358_3055 [Paenibacillus sp. NFR01]
MVQKYTIILFRRTKTAYPKVNFKVMVRAMWAQPQIDRIKARTLKFS